ncbi:aminotransferase class III [Natronorubrum sp. FCH18a]|uniref:aminotransferase class III n=1 Tax=Natronorubrum sp. FCH18a TaxID=3447018 RepID=UPI003F50E42D
MTFERSATNDRAVKERCDDYLMPIRKRLDAPIERADDRPLEDFDDNTYLDLFSGTAVANASHESEAIGEALEAEAAGGADV